MLVLRMLYTITAVVVVITIIIITKLLLYELKETIRGVMKCATN